MRTIGANGVGRISVEFEVANYDDLILARDGHLPPDKVRRQRIAGVVDSERAKLVLPQGVVRQLGLRLRNKIKVETALIGFMVLEALDLLVDCQQQRLVPRDPSGPIYEIE